MTPFQIIVNMVIEETGMRWTYINGHSQDIEAIRARWMIYWAVRKTSEMSYPMMARKMNRDRSTIIYGFNQAAKMRRISPQFKAFTDRLVAAVPDKDVPA